MSINIYTNENIKANNLIVDNITINGSSGDINNVLQKDSNNNINWNPISVISDFFFTLGNIGFSPFANNNVVNTTVFALQSGMIVASKNITINVNGTSKSRYF